MNKTLIAQIAIPAALAAATAGLFATTAEAQYGRPQGNPFEDFITRLGRGGPNPAMECTVYRRINRQGEITWLRMDCNARD